MLRAFSSHYLYNSTKHAKRLPDRAAFLVDLELGEGIGLGGDFELSAFDVGVNLRGVEVFMAQNLLKRLQIHAV